MFESKIFRIDEDRFISYFDVGEGGVVLVLVHGWLASKESWIPFIQSLDKTKFRVIAIDVLGHGESTRSLKLRFDTFENVSIISKMIVSFGLKNTVIVGHSSGGKLAIFLATRLFSLSEELVKKVILINSIGSREFWETLPFFLRVLLFSPIGSVLRVLALPSIIKLYFKKLLFPSSMPPNVKDNVTKYLSDYVSIHFRTLKNRICASRVTRNVFDVFVESVDRRSLPPVEIIYSRDDKLVPIKIQYKLSQLFGAPVYMIPDFGHITLLEAPEKLAELVTTLLENF